MREFDDLQKNYKEVSPEILKEELKKIFINIKTNKRNFEEIYFETDEYKVIKSEEALKGLTFFTLSIEPNINIDKIDLLELFYQAFKSKLKEKKDQKYKFILFYHVTKDQEEEKAFISKNKHILNKSDINFVIDSL